MPGDWKALEMNKRYGVISHCSFLEEIAPFLNDEGYLTLTTIYFPCVVLLSSGVLVFCLAPPQPLTKQRHILTQGKGPHGTPGSWKRHRRVCPRCCCCAKGRKADAVCLCHIRTLEATQGGSAERGGAAPLHTCLRPCECRVQLSVVRRNPQWEEVSKK